MDLTILKHAIGKDHPSQRWIFFDSGKAFATDGLVTLSMPSGLDIGERFAVESKMVFKAKGYEPHVDSEDGFLELVKGASSVQIPFIGDASSFETLEPVHEGHITVGEGFTASLERIAPAISTEETRFYLNGVLLHYINENVGSFMVATDGHRLHYQRLMGHKVENLERAGEDAVTGEGVGCIVPRRAVEILLKMKKPVQSFSVSASLITFWLTDGIMLTVPTIKGTFPDWRRIAPAVASDDNRDAMDVDRKAFAAALKEHKALNIYDAITLKFQDPELKFISRSPSDDTQAVYRTNVRGWQQEYGFEVIFTRRYLEDILKALPDEGPQVTVWVSRNGPGIDPTAFGEDGCFVLMPRRH